MSVAKSSHPNLWVFCSWMWSELCFHIHFLSLFSCISLKQIQITTSRFYHYLLLGGFVSLSFPKKVYGGDSAPWAKRWRERSIVNSRAKAKMDDIWTCQGQRLGQWCWLRVTREQRSLSKSKKCDFTCENSCCIWYPICIKIYQRFFWMLFPAITFKLSGTTHVLRISRPARWSSDAPHDVRSRVCQAKILWTAAAKMFRTSIQCSSFSFPH